MAVDLQRAERRDRASPFITRLSLVTFGVALLLAAYTGARLPSLWQASHYSVSLNDGFYRRFLVGTVLRPFAQAVDYNYWFFAGVAYLILGTLITIVVVSVTRASSLSRRFVVVAWLLLPTGGFFFHEVGRLDQTVYLLLFVALWLIKRSRWIAATAVMVGAVVTHEVSLLVALPVFAYVALSDPDRRRSLIAIGVPASIGGVLLLLPAAAGDARERFRQQLASANFRPREQMFELYERTLTENWREYSVAKSLLFVLPIAVLVVVGALVLQRLGSRDFPMMAILAATSPALLVFGGWDQERWVFLLLTNFALVLWLWLDDAELTTTQVGWLAVVLVATTHVPLTYFNNYSPRGVSPAEFNEIIDAISDGALGDLKPPRF